MAKQKKTDNKSLNLKVALRARVIREAGLGELRVLDLCAGAGHIWREMGKAHKIIAYVPVDQKPRMPGTIKGALSNRLLAAFDMAGFNVVDVDTYGEPWLAWLNLSVRITGRTVFFLTHGITGMMGTNTSKLARSILGIPPDWDIPKKPEISALAARYALRAGGAEIVKGWKVELPNVTYYGLICDCKKMDCRLPCTGTSARSQSEAPGRAVRGLRGNDKEGGERGRQDGN